MNIYNKYKYELDKIKLYTNNDYIFNMFLYYGFNIDNKFIKLDSNINIYESGFVSLLIKYYILKYKKKEKLNILEIGLAYGTSSIIIINQILQYPFSKSFDILDPYQEKDWNNYGIKHIKQFLGNKKLDYHLYNEDSTIIMPKLRKKYDIIFIDGSHFENIVIQDLENSDKKIKINGFIILDDVKHDGVKKALLLFFNNNNKYIKIHMNRNENDIIADKIIYDNNSIKKSFINPNTMFCFQKIRL